MHAARIIDSRRAELMHRADGSSPKLRDREVIDVRTNFQFVRFNLLDDTGKVYFAGNYGRRVALSCLLNAGLRATTIAHGDNYAMRDLYTDRRIYPLNFWYQMPL